MLAEASSPAPHPGPSPGSSVGCMAGAVGALGGAAAGSQGAGGSGPNEDLAPTGTRSLRWCHSLRAVASWRQRSVCTVVSSVVPVAPATPAATQISTASLVVRLNSSARSRTCMGREPTGGPCVAGLLPVVGVVVLEDDVPAVEAVLAPVRRD